MNLEKILSIILSSAMLIAAVGCSSGNPQGNASVSEATTASEEITTAAEQTSDTVTVTDHAGNVVEIPKNIQRIAVCDIYPLPSVLAVFFDGADKIVGMAEPSMTAAKNSLLSQLYPEILNAETGYIDGTNVNIEELLSLSPDVVFYSADNAELGDKLRSAGFSAVAISASKWDYDANETLKNWISLLGEMFPDNDKTEKVEKYSDEVYSMVQERVASLPDSEKQNVFFLFKYSDSNITTSGKLFFGQWWADAIGANNVGEELDTNNSAAVGMEQIYKWNPSVIFITNFNSAQPDTLYDNTVGSYDWSGIDAVKNKRVYKMPLGIYRSYTAGVDTPVTLLWLAKTTYPELFSDIDITEKTKEYYKDVFGIDLTDEQADMIFTPVSDASAY